MSMNKLIAVLSKLKLKSFDGMFILHSPKILTVYNDLIDYINGLQMSSIHPFYKDDGKDIETKNNFAGVANKISSLNAICCLTSSLFYLLIRFFSNFV